MDEITIKKYLGLRIRQLRKQQQITQFTLGEKIDLDQRQIAYIEGGNCFPTLKTLNKLAIYFSCEIKDLFDFEHLIKQHCTKEKITKKLNKMDTATLRLCEQIIDILEKNRST